MGKLRQGLSEIEGNLYLLNLYFASENQVFQTTWVEKRHLPRDSYVLNPGICSYVVLHGEKSCISSVDGLKTRRLFQIVHATFSLHHKDPCKREVREKTIESEVGDQDVKSGKAMSQRSGWPVATEKVKGSCSPEPAEGGQGCQRIHFSVDVSGALSH